ncbi:MAG: hypothetical protein AAGJ81_07085 [Verrucomicrobiota bacterium]
MIERRFRELVHSYLSGSVSPTELSWVVEDLHRRRERRDLFLVLVEDFLEASKQSDNENQPLKGLLLKDLTHIEQRDLERAMPRQDPLVSSMEQIQGREPKEDDVDEGELHTNRVRLESKRSKPASRRVVEEERSFVLPIIGLLILLVSLIFMIRFSSFESSSGGKDEEADLSEEIPDASAFRQATEFLEDGQFVQESIGTSLEEVGPEPGLTVSNQPISLVDLIGNSEGLDLGVDGIQDSVIGDPTVESFTPESHPDSP